MNGGRLTHTLREISLWISAQCDSLRNVLTGFELTTLVTLVKQFCHPFQVLEIIQHCASLNCTSHRVRARSELAEDLRFLKQNNPPSHLQLPLQLVPPTVTVGISSHLEDKVFWNVYLICQYLKYQIKCTQMAKGQRGFPTGIQTLVMISRKKGKKSYL